MACSVKCVTASGLQGHVIVRQCLSLSGSSLANFTHAPLQMPPPGMLAPPGALSGRGPPAHLQAQRPPGAPPGAPPGTSMSQPQHLPGTRVLTFQTAAFL